MMNRARTPVSDGRLGKSLARTKTAAFEAAAKPLILLVIFGCGGLQPTGLASVLSGVIYEYRKAAVNDSVDKL